MKPIHVTRFQDIDTTKYKEGNLFSNGRQYAMLQNGKVEPLLTRKDVHKMIDDKLKKVVGKDE